MSGLDQRLFVAFERHDADGIRAALDAGLDPRAPIRGKTPIEWLLEMYTRSDRFPACVRAMLERGASLPDPTLEPVLLDDPDALRRAVDVDPSRLTRRVSLAAAFTPLDGATLLHVAAEYGHVAAARALLDLGADPDARAGFDADGLGGQTPIFHVVNSHANRSLPVLRLLLDAGARADLRIDGLVWGRGCDWETTLFDLTPLSYAQCGLMRQMHRDERDVDAVVRLLLEVQRRSVPPMANLPNRYLEPRG
ncbi:MAG: ankyrin repeat domain-containing protein [Planctomycetes bacterium]|nr:ankyrin repeat domain-containing protein [Planctomycetota bacterium]